MRAQLDHQKRYESSVDAMRYGNGHDRSIDAVISRNFGVDSKELYLRSLRSFGVSTASISVTLLHYYGF